MSEVGTNLVRGHIRGVALVVKEDEITNVVDVGLLCLEAEVLEPDRLSDLIEQAGGLGLGRLWHCQVVDKIPNRGVIRQK